MKIKFPILILGYSPSRIFSTEDNFGRAYLPVFDDPGKAESYRIFFAREYSQALEAYIIPDIKQTIPLFNLLLTVDPGLEDIIINPPPPISEKMGGQIVHFYEFLNYLDDQHKMRVNRRHRRRMGDKNRSTRTK